MTLLELVIAIAALASISTLAAALWAQMRDWSGENAAHHQALAQHRARELAHEQWHARLLSVRLDEDGDSAVSLTPDHLRFVSSSPVLFREWPMVRVTLTIERDVVTLVGASSSARLIYEEMRIVDPSSAIAEQATVEREDGFRRIVLLDGFEDLRWERYADESDDVGVVGRRSGQRVGWFPVDENISVPTAATRTGRSNKGETEQPATADAPSAPALKGVRLVGERDREQVAWQFIAARSR